MRLIGLRFSKLGTEIAGVLGNILLGGYNFTWYGASFRPSKLNPLAGLKRMVGLQAFVALHDGELDTLAFN